VTIALPPSGVMKHASPSCAAPGGRERDYSQARARIRA
jgi:hypothetical protein